MLQPQITEADTPGTLQTHSAYFYVLSKTPVFTYLPVGGRGQNEPRTSGKSELAEEVAQG